MVYLLVSYIVTDTYDEYEMIFGDTTVKSTSFPSRDEIRRHILTQYDIKDNGRHKISIIGIYQFQTISDYMDYIREPKEKLPLT